MGLNTRPLRLDMDEIARLAVPAILHWELSHFVVLVRAGRGWIEIHDPARGKRRVGAAEIDRCFTGVALELIPGEAFERRTHVERVRLSDLWTSLRGLAPFLWQLGLLALVVQVFAVLSPMLNQLVIDDAIMKGDLGLLTTIGVGMVVLLLIQTGIGLLQGFVGLYLGSQLSFQMQSNLLRHALRLPVDWFEKRHLGDILTRFQSLGPAQAFLTGVPVSVPLNILMLLAGGTMAVLYSPLLFGCAVAAMLIPFLVQWATVPWVRRMTDEGLNLQARASTVFMETLRGARTFKMMGRDRERVAQWQNEEAAALNNSVTLARVGLWGGAGLGIVTGLQGVAIWWLGASQVICGAMSLGMLMAFQSYAGQFTGAVRALVGTWFQWKTLELHLERLADVIHQDIEPGCDTPLEDKRRFTGALAMRGLSFRYASHEPPVLEGVDLAVAAGEFLAITGPSGGGKTTLLKLMLGVLTPQEGVVLADGVGLSQFGLRTYRSRVAAVMQDDRLFQGTIADNVAFFDAESDMERVRAALEQACVLDDIEAMPMGLLTLVGDLGNALSGGQQQRVLLARAMYRRPAILFLDEGTAHLDAGTERRVMASIAAAGCTRIVVAHRPAAIEGADRVVAVIEGRVEEAGKHVGIDRSN
jgi:ATP-binding cassette, subfamily B, bacterial CvaB/MchF/RaxB